MYKMTIIFTIIVRIRIILIKIRLRNYIDHTNYIMWVSSNTLTLLELY